LDQRFAAPMYIVSILSLLTFAVLLHFHEREEFYGPWLGSLIASMVFYPCFVAEYIAALMAGSPRSRERLWCCLLPPLRLAARDHETGTRIWLPTSGWQTVSADLRVRLEKAGNVPMIAVALLVLPLIGIEYQYADQIEHNPRWAASIAAATTLIWFAFTFEFVVMCSVAERKFEYCKKHWLDLAIILLPLVAFLRALRLGRLLRLQQISRTARVYRMRGVTMRAWKALLVFGIVRRIIHGRPEQRLKKLGEIIAQKEQELAELRQEQLTLQMSLTPSVPLTRVEGTSQRAA
jgi:voltage-gated potassium channel